MIVHRIGNNITIESTLNKSAMKLNENEIKLIKNTAMQPIFEALQLPEYEMILENEKVVCVEGIYDKYSMEIFCNLPKNTRIFPSMGADSIIKNIPYFIAYNKNYIALWDSDDEGKRNFEKAKKLFGESESQKFGTLPNSKKIRQFRMEEMIAIKDRFMIKKTLGLSEKEKYESIIYSLYYADKGTKSSVLNSLSDETKDNFKTLEKMITTHFDK